MLSSVFLDSATVSYISCMSIVVPNTGTTNTGTQILVRKLCKELEVLIYIESDLMSFSLRR